MVAATVGPGLVGSLLVGVSAAKSIAIGFGVPFVGVNHLEGHLYAAFLEDPEIALPAVVLLVSGGHTLLVAMPAVGEYSVLGGTVDDAAGEAFDKIARFLDLGYPGGPVVEQIAASGSPDAIAFPAAMASDGFDFSFSGLKSAVVREVRARPDRDSADVAASFQAAVVDVLVSKTLVRPPRSIGARSICIAGGRGGERRARSAIAAAGGAAGYHVYLPEPARCAPTTRR